MLLHGFLRDAYAPWAAAGIACATLLAGLPAAAGADAQPAPITAWIDLHEVEAAGAPAPISEGAARRRARLHLPTADAFDRPLDPAAVAAVRARVQRIRAASRFLRSVSVEATPGQLRDLAALPCVARIEPASEGRRRPDGDIVPSVAPIDAGPPERLFPAAPPYGDSQAQLALMRVPELHDRGLTGLGVLIAHFDTGYEQFTHDVFRAMRVVAMRDFVDGDGDPTDFRRYPDERGDHGTITLSVVGGFHPGKLVGSAFGASYALARTERSTAEEAVEEDYWIAALEWADSLGADIVSSSLKFREVDLGIGGYSWFDMDGQTARVTQAAAVAERRGILIFNGVGNDGYDAIHNTLVAPADGIDVMAVGATTLGGTLANFSSCGPTTDPPARIKPDVVAPGASVWAADVAHDSSYARVSGTSLSTPLVAGVAALLLSVHDATPAQIRTVLRQTASRSSTPDNRWGWGMVDALAAYQALIALYPTDAHTITPRVSAPVFANPFRPDGAIAFALDAPGAVRLRIYDAWGRRVREWSRDAVSVRSERVTWDGADATGRPLARGTYFVELRSLPAQGAGTTVTRKLTLWR